MLNKAQHELVEQTAVHERKLLNSASFAAKVYECLYNACFYDAAEAIESWWPWYDDYAAAMICRANGIKFVPIR